MKDATAHLICLPLVLLWNPAHPPRQIKKKREIERGQRGHCGGKKIDFLTNYCSGFHDIGGGVICFTSTAKVREKNERESRR